MKYVQDVFNALSKVDPAVYIALGGLVVSVLHYRIKQVRDFTRRNNVLISLLLPAAAAALRSSADFQHLSMLVHQLVVTGSPIYVISQLVYQGMTRKWEQLDAQPTVPTSTAF